MLQLPFNLAKATDSYKVSHWLQFPGDTEKLFYYIESRSKDKIIVPFGIQALIKEYLLRVPTEEEVYEAKDFWEAHGFANIFNLDGWLAIAERGYLPLEIKAVPEGMPIPTGNAIVTVVNTEPAFFWLPGWVETLLMQVWYPTTVATRSWEIRRIIRKYLEKTGDVNGLPFKLHDFGFRGTTSYQAAMIGGMAHMVNFMGSDTTAGIEGVWAYYDPDNKKEMPSFSIPAAEHSTITSWGKENEADAYRNMLTQFAHRNSIVAVVSDSYDLENAVENIWGKEIKQEVIESGATVVIRPDSGDPKEVLIRTLKQLANAFGYKTNDKGYNVLNNVRVIQGDGVSNPSVIEDMLKAVVAEKFSVDNVAFGMGAGLLQKLDRDTYKFAMKCSARFNGKQWLDVKKEPKDAPWKTSKAGVLETVNDNGDIKTLDKRYHSTQYNTLMETVFLNGKIPVEWDFDTIRRRASINL